MASVSTTKAPLKRNSSSANVAGRFGEYGGRYVPETLMAALDELEREYEKAKGDRKFQERLDLLSRVRGFAVGGRGRPGHGRPQLPRPRRLRRNPSKRPWPAPHLRPAPPCGSVRRYASSPNSLPPFNHHHVHGGIVSWEVSTVASPSSPERDAASGASMRCSLPPRARRSW